MGVKDKSLSQSPPSTNTDSDSGSTENEESVDQSESVTEQSVEKPSLDLIFEVLKNSRRREVIKYLREQDDRVSLGELAEHVAAIENDTTTDALTSSQRKRVYVGLYQCHLPKMDDIGVVDFNQDRGHVELTEQAVFFEEYLDDSDDTTSRPWYRYYAAISVVGFGVVFGSLVFSIPGWAVMSSLTLVVLVAAACSVLHWHVEQNTSE